MPTPTRTREKIPHPSKDAIDLAGVMRVLGDQVRLDIARLLSDGEARTCTALQDELGLPPSTGSYHLKLLREAGVTRTQAIGTTRLISLRRDDLDERFPGLVDVLTR